MADLRTDDVGERTYTADEFVKQVDLSAWDMAIACGSCHIGGGLVEKDKNDVRLSKRPMTPPAMTPNFDTFNAYDYYVAEYWDVNGAPAHYSNDQNMNAPLDNDGSAAAKAAGFKPAKAPWSYPMEMNGQVVYSPAGYGMDHPDQANNPGMKTVMMPNVREMDCLFCHMEGYNNVVSSVAVQMGALNAAPSFASGMMNLFTQAYMPNMVSVDPNTGIASMSGAVVSRIKGNPPTDNCRLCHSPTTMENFSDMFDKFLAASPMSYNPSNPMAGPTGLAMPAYDLNAPFMAPNETSPVVVQTATGWEYEDGTDAGGPFAGMFPMALFPSWADDQTDAAMNGGGMGGDNAGMTGPIYFANPMNMQDQETLKKAMIPFPRADFFKRGDLWDDSQAEVHQSFGCAGCHMDTNALNGDKNQCDPGRGYARLGGVEAGFDGDPNDGVAPPDSRNTVKRCENCHITGTNFDGAPIQTYGAQDPTAAHAAAGLTALVTNAYGTKEDGTVGTFKGSHLDVIDCTVCHMYKESMAVRALDATSGNRYPTIIGSDNSGMLGMFTNPMGVPEGTPGYTHEMQTWTPLRGWWQNGSPTLADGVTPNPEYRRKIYNINMITAVLWDNDGALDANGDLTTGADAGEGAHGFDPWIQRDLKAGMNFADTGFAVAPVGFGAPTSTYGSSLDGNGMFTGAWDYVGIYGGNVIFTNPDQISAYKTHRGADWADTKLMYFGGPFQVTHNVVSTSQYALGKSCDECHATDAGFFNGHYDMTGSAIPAYASSPDPLPNGMPDNMMARPLVDIEITAGINDLVTGAEAQYKVGGNADVEYEEHGCWDAATGFELALADGTCASTGAAATHKRTVDMERGEFMYPEDATIADNMEIAANFSKEAFGIGIDPQAVIDASVPASVELNSTVTLAADQLVNTQGTFTYSWTTDMGISLAGEAPQVLMDKLGAWTFTLKVEDEEGKVDYASTTINVTNPVPTGPVSYDAVAGTVSFNELPASYTRLYVIWGDGARGWYNLAAPATEIAHNYATPGSKLVTAYVYDGYRRVSVERGSITVP